MNKQKSLLLLSMAKLMLLGDNTVDMPLPSDFISYDKIIIIASDKKETRI